MPTAKVEVILIDNGSTDHTQSAITTWAQTMPFPVRNILESKPGLSSARNAGLRTASGKTLVFTDDDCTLNPDYLTVLSHYIQTDATPVIRGGRVELGDPADLPFTILLDTEYKQLGANAHPSGFIIGANMVIPRTVANRVGLFDERFGAGAVFKAGEESDYIYRATGLGIPIVYAPDLIVQHFHGRRDPAGLSALSYGYFLGNGAMYAKYIKEKRLLRHLWWELKAFAGSLVSKDNTTDPVTGLRYCTLIKATFHGMLLYAWTSLCAKQ